MPRTSDATVAPGDDVRDGAGERADAGRGPAGRPADSIVWIELEPDLELGVLAAGTPGPPSHLPPARRPRNGREDLPRRTRIRNAVLVALALLAPLAVGGAVLARTGPDAPSPPSGGAPGRHSGSSGASVVAAEGTEAVTVADSPRAACGLALEAFASRRATIDRLRADLVILVRAGEGTDAPTDGAAAPVPVAPAPAHGSAPAADGSSSTSDVSQAQLFHANTPRCAAASASCAAAVRSAEDVAGLSNALLDQTTQLRLRLTNDGAGRVRRVDPGWAANVERATSVAADADVRSRLTEDALGRCVRTAS